MKISVWSILCSFISSHLLPLVAILSLLSISVLFWYMWSTSPNLLPSLGRLYHQRLCDSSIIFAPPVAHFEIRSLQARSAKCARWKRTRLCNILDTLSERSATLMFRSFYQIDQCLNSSRFELRAIRCTSMAGDCWSRLEDVLQDAALVSYGLVSKWWHPDQWSLMIGIPNGALRRGVGIDHRLQLHANNVNTKSR